MGASPGGNIILTGFSYSGKTKVGQEVARKLGWMFVDIDDEVVRLCGKPVSEIFTQDGEERFRDALQFAVANPGLVKGLILESAFAGIKNEKERDARMKSDEETAAFIYSNSMRTF